MKDLSLKEILELAAQKFRECSESPEEIENLDETIAEIVKIKIIIALIGAAIGLVLSIMFWSTLIESLGHLFDR